ncbi:aldo/keto reductase [Clostridium estertheticum]|uniref:Aldo/keto reductase n=1 Tax=Clostridium estertheticum TaxID=238834 RepID=A0AA47EG09_9CLOT|nr:aldo/keto reductase [Clostridium estertheticum]MBU3157924.1 aldo/keto reductase [Clostridium estertheticum]WAG59400.1 aldo/keto reductase [Clostridium estertheticum]
MEYRELPHGGGKVSTIGIGAGSLSEASPQQVRKIIEYGMQKGINLMDTVMYDSSAQPAIAAALEGHRDKMVMQIHLGAYYPHGQYVRTRDLKQLQKGFEQELKSYHTEYADIGMIHCVDEMEDLENIIHGGILDYAVKLKQNGIIRYLAVSSHSPKACLKLLETGKIDLFMLSLNAAYDFEPVGEKLTLSDTRMKLYQECSKRGVGITVMKPYGGGQLLNDRTSPLGRKMSIYQCIQYALDRPAVLSCLPGVRNLQDLKDVLKYYDLAQNEKDYSFIGTMQRQDIQGSCIYCNHCQPCPQEINIGLVNKYLDLAKAGDELARDHYQNLKHHASDCIECGVCEKNCPFHVEVREKMKEAVEFFQ